MRCADNVVCKTVLPAAHDRSEVSNSDIVINRRTFINGAAVLSLGSGVSALLPGQAQGGSPFRNGSLPGLGMNSANLFNLNYSAIAESEKSRLLELIACSDSLLLETSAEFMRAQRLVGSLRRCLHKNTGAIAIRIWADDAESAGNQLNLARHQLGVQAVDLVQLEIRGDWRGQLQLLQSRVELGEVVNIGLVARHPDQYAAVEEAVHADAVQYIRLVYSAVERDAELRLMPLAQERGVRLLADRIFASGKLLDQTVGRKLPNWLIASGISTWEQLWFQYSISHPAVDTVMVPIRSLDGLLCYEKWLKDILLSPGQREEVARLAANLI